MFLALVSETQCYRCILRLIIRGYAGRDAVAVGVESNFCFDALLFERPLLGFVDAFAVGLGEAVETGCVGYDAGGAFEDMEMSSSTWSSERSGRSGMCE